VAAFTVCELSSNNLNIKLPSFSFEGTWIAGGAVRDSILGEQRSDIDIFGESKEALEKFITDNLSNARIVYDSELMKTYKLGKDKIQVIFRPYQTITNCLDSFDYTICQFAYDGEKIFCNPESLIAIHRRALVVHRVHSEFSLDSLRRLQKYIKKGYTICNGGLADLARALQQLNIEQLEQQILFYPDGSPRLNRFD